MQRLTLSILAPDRATVDEMAAMLRTVVDAAAAKVSGTEHVSDLYRPVVVDPDVAEIKLAYVPIAE